MSLLDQMSCAFKILKDVANVYNEKSFLKHKAIVKFIRRMVGVGPIESRAQQSFRETGKSKTQSGAPRAGCIFFPDTPRHYCLPNNVIF